MNEQFKVQIAISIIENQYPKLKSYNAIENHLNEDEIVFFLNEFNESELNKLSNIGANKITEIQKCQSLFKERLEVLNSLKEDDEILCFMFHHIQGIKTDFNREFIGLFDFINYLIYSLNYYSNYKGEYLKVFENLLGYLINTEKFNTHEIAYNVKSTEQSVRNWRDNILNENGRVFFGDTFFFISNDLIISLLKNTYSIRFEKGFLSYDFDEVRESESVKFSNIFISKILTLIYNNELVLIGNESDLTLDINTSDNHLEQLYFINKSILNQFYSASTKPLINFIEKLFDDTIDSTFEEGNRLDYIKYSDLIKKFSLESEEIIIFTKQLLEFEFNNDIKILLDKDLFIISKKLTIEKSIVYALNYISGFARVEDISNVLSSEPFNFEHKKEQIHAANLSRVTSIGKTGLYINKDIFDQKIRINIGSGTREEILLGLINEYKRPVHIYTLYKFIFENNLFYWNGEESERNPASIFKSIYSINKYHNKETFFFFEGNYIGLEEHSKMKFSRISRKAFRHLRQLNKEGKDFEHILSISRVEYHLTEIQTIYILDNDIREVVEEFEEVETISEVEKLKTCPLTFCEIPNILKEVDLKEINIRTSMRIDLAKLYEDSLLLIDKDGLVKLKDELKTFDYINFESINIKDRINISQ